ncbi:hypothetical protein SJ348_04205, partial [Enterobacter sp. CRENT-193]|nr:hypothetical protein [Enterobacter sp. CRENT-193]
GTVCVVGKMRDLILQLSKSSIYSTKPFRSCVFHLSLVPQYPDIPLPDGTLRNDIAPPKQHRRC